MGNFNNRIRVGIIGVDPVRGWASIAHIPAIKALPQYDLVAISNRNADKLLEAGKSFQVDQLFTDSSELITSADIDLVVVTVKVQYHKELVTAILDAGKQVFCEWPLGNGLVEAIDMTNLIRQKKLFGAVGLQARFVPAITYIKDLVREGYIGEVLSTTLVGSGIIQGETIEEAFAYAADSRNGAGMIYSTLANAVDALCYCLGEFESLNATTATRRKEIVIRETGITIPMTSFDQVAFTGILQSGTVASVHYRGGMFRGTNFYWEIIGTNGELVITAAGGHPGVFELTIRSVQGNGIPLENLVVPDAYYLINSIPRHSPAFNLAHNYIRIAKDLLEGTHLSASFDDALIRHKMINAIEVSGSTGMRENYL
ncbi:MAG: Gfo/Idh/MocA family oxidoreductase [Chitinophagaceae bacterium]